MKRIYLDHNATTPLAPEILAALPQAAMSFGNPSSIHWSGREPKAFLREARQKLATSLGVQATEIVFTSGATEASNALLKSLFASQKKLSKTICITSSVEHPAVRETVSTLQSQGAQIYTLKVNRQGVLDVGTLWDLLETYRNKIAFVSVMLANNETGHLFPLAEIAQRAHAAGAYVHSDCVQGLGKVEINLKTLDIDCASFSAHKVYALKGVGALYIKRGVPFEPLLHGGGQERHRRGGTENTLGIWSFGLMAQKIPDLIQMQKEIQRLRDSFESQVQSMISGVRITGVESPRLPNTSSLVIDGVDGETLLINLDIKGIAVSTGAACTSGNPEPSPVLLAMGLDRSEAQSSLRVSLGMNTTAEEMKEFLETLSRTVLRLRSLQGLDRLPLNEVTL